MARHRRHLRDAQAHLGQARDPRMPKVVKVQVLDAEHLASPCPCRADRPRVVRPDRAPSAFRPRLQFDHGQARRRQRDADIVATAATWRGAQASIRAQRLARKEAARQAVDAAALESILAQWRNFVAQMRAALGA